MAGYRDRFIYGASRWVKLVPHHLLQLLTRQNLILPVYHLVSNDHVPHVSHLYKIKSKREFENDLEYLLRHYKPIDFQTLEQHVHNSIPFDRPSFFLTFDDGLEEFDSVIAPMLEQYGVPAMNFLNTAFINNQDIFYRYKASLLIDRIKGLTKIDLGKVGQVLGVSLTNKNEIYRSLLTIDYESQHQLDDLASFLEVDFSEYLASRQPYLNSKQIISLINRGFTFGSHSIDHPLYADISFEEQIRQTKVSTLSVVDQFNLDYRVFAFPFTDFQVSRKFFDQLFCAPINMDISFGSAGLKHDIYPHHLHRIPMEMGTLSAREIIRSEMMYFFLKSIRGKNKIKRV